MLCCETGNVQQGSLREAGCSCQSGDNVNSTAAHVQAVIKTDSRTACCRVS